MSATATKILLQTIRDNDGADWQKPVKAFLKNHKLSKDEKKALGLDIYHEVLKCVVANLHIDPKEAQMLQEVQAYFQLSDKAVNEVKYHYAPKVLRMMAEWFLIDGIITPSERAQLIAFGKEMTFTEKEVEDFLKSMMPEKNTADKKNNLPKEGSSI